MENLIHLPSLYGDLEISCISSENQDAVIIKKSFDKDACFIRIHSSCLFSEALHTNDCDCALQLNAALHYISRNGGVVVYLYQEGRGIGIKSKIDAILLQQREGIDTATAFRKLGYEIDPRDYTAAINALKSLNIRKAVVATNNPLKLSAINSAGIEISKRITLQVEKNPTQVEYLKEKTKALGHHEDSE
ncbi:GTP cyclohydrolase II RibA [Pseudomonas pseudonitroreducens]|uniref:GTP cyclohydrolase II RibA n=1 Tax=Pseudomonas pseudonitroreducens TaxID=2892326 RepID=UPI001F19E2C6|nr:GTP cyclohydrolase II RibA [Pseudomonas pseudonitroreducens]